MSAIYIASRVCFMEKNYSSTMERPEWIRFFMEFILFDDLKEDVTECFIRHLAELGVLVSVDDNMWQWKNFDSPVDSEKLMLKVQTDLELLIATNRTVTTNCFSGSSSSNSGSIINF